MKRKLHISECTFDDVVAEDVFNARGTLLLSKGTVINKYLIQRLTELGTEHVWVTKKEENVSILDMNYKIFEKKYTDSVKVMKSMTLELVKGKKFNYSVVHRVANMVISSGNEPAHVVKCLLNVRDADSQTYHHCVNVSFYAMMLAGWLNLAREDIMTATEAGLLHDLGKARIPDSLLNKKGKLNWHEMEEIKRHTMYGYDLVKDNPRIPKSVKDVILMHHEREDGSGYPLGIEGCKMSMYAKIVAVADVYDAMVSDRPYKKALTPFGAFEEFYTICSGILDTYVVNTMVYNLSRYYTGSRVMLSNGETGSVLYIPPHCIWKPIIDTGSEFLDLSREQNVSITSMA